MGEHSPNLVTLVWHKKRIVKEVEKNFGLIHLFGENKWLIQKIEQKRTLIILKNKIVISWTKIMIKK
jgi:hypothetical protein